MVVIISCLHFDTFIHHLRGTLYFVVAQHGTPPYSIPPTKNYNIRHQDMQQTDHEIGQTTHNGNGPITCNGNCSTTPSDNSANI